MKKYIENKLIDKCKNDVNKKLFIKDKKFAKNK